MTSQSLTDGRTHALRLGRRGPSPDYRAYHDLEWGVPIRDERHLFELLILEGAQAGLSWWTILRKRDGYRAAFAGFDPAAVAAFGEADTERLLADAGIVRNRGKIASAIGNARATLALQAAGSTPRRPPVVVRGRRGRSSTPGRTMGHASRPRRTSHAR